MKKDLIKKSTWSLRCFIHQVLYLIKKTRLHLKIEEFLLLTCLLTYSFCYWILILPRLISSNLVLSIFFYTMSFCKSQKTFSKMAILEYSQSLVFFPFLYLVMSNIQSLYLRFNNFYSCYILWEFCG